MPGSVSRRMLGSLGHICVSMSPPRCGARAREYTTGGPAPVQMSEVICIRSPGHHGDMSPRAQRSTSCTSGGSCPESKRTSGLNDRGRIGGSVPAIRDTSVSYGPALPPQDIPCIACFRHRPRACLRVPGKSWRHRRPCASDPRKASETATRGRPDGDRRGDESDISAPIGPAARWNSTPNLYKKCRCSWGPLCSLIREAGTETCFDSLPANRGS
jgi:hypothetical protein